LQPLQECADAGFRFGMSNGPGCEHADPPHPLGLLRLCRERPGCRAAKERDEFAPSHFEPLLSLPRQ
jgi:hypothetical protein